MILKERMLAFVDCETTGLDENAHEIIEIGILIYDQNTDSVVKEWDIKIAPSHIETASKDALSINGYYSDPGSYIGNLKSALIKLNSLVKGCVLVGQNIDFDLRFLYRAMAGFDIVPSFHRRDKLELMSLSWWAIRNSNVPAVGLKHLCEYFGVSNIGAHTALADCRRSYEVYRRLCETIDSWAK